MSSSEVQRTRSPIGEMVMYDNGVIVHTLDAGALVEESAAAEVLEKTKELSDGEPVGIVVDLSEIAFATHQSRELFARDPSGGVEVATALVASARVAEFLASQFVNTARPERPTELFASVDEATGWVAEQVRLARES